MAMIDSHAHVRNKGCLRFFIDFPHNRVDFRQIPTNVTKSNVDVAVFYDIAIFDLRLPVSILRDLCIDFAIFFSHDVEVVRRSNGQVFFHFFWTDDMGINDQIYT